jgi:hypothetical protein
MNQRELSLAEKKAKNKYFSKFHLSLVKKYGTKENHFSYKKINLLRALIFSEHLDREGIIKYCELKMEMPHAKRKHPIVWYNYLLNFVKYCTDDVWKDLSQPKKFIYEDTLDRQS